MTREEYIESWLDEALASYDEPYVWADLDDEDFVNIAEGES